MKKIINILIRFLIYIEIKLLYREAKKYPIRSKKLYPIMDKIYDLSQINKLIKQTLDNDKNI